MMEFLMVLHYAGPVALASVGEVVTQKSGLINIGLEGSMLVASFFGMLACYATHSPWIGLMAAVGSGLALTLLFGVFAVYLASDQVVVGTAINLFALGLTGTMLRAKFSSGGNLLSVPRIPSWNGIDPLMALLVLSVPAIWFLLQKTAWGLAVRSAGEYPKSTEASGFSVNRLRMQALSIGGLYAGLAGGYLTLVITGAFADNMTAGRGFVAIAMVTFGRWKPQWTFFAALLIGYVESLQYKLQTSGWNVSYQMMIALPYVVALLVLIIVGKGALAPQALGQPYRRDK